MKSESLRLQIILQTNNPVKNLDGSETPLWSDTATVRASKEHQNSRKFFAAQKANAETTDLFIIRYQDGVTAQMRITYGTRYYDIVGANDPDGKRREVWLLAKEVV